MSYHIKPCVTTAGGHRYPYLDQLDEWRFVAQEKWDDPEVLSRQFQSHIRLGALRQRIVNAGAVYPGGLLHDGSVDTLLSFLSSVVFAGFRLFPALYPDPDLARRQLAAYIMAFDTNLAPIVGQQVTLTHENTAAATARIDLLEARADTHFAMAGAALATECEVIVKGVLNGEARGWVRLHGWRPDIRVGC